MTIKEEKRDLFTMPDDYALVHCISADFKLGAGIAKEFDRRFNCRDNLFHVAHGDMTDVWDDGICGNCIVTHTKHIEPIIFNLITKRNYWDKPTPETLKSALVAMRFNLYLYGIKKVAMPRIGCGLDRQKWSDVRRLIEDVFCDTDIEIVVCVK